MAAVIGAAMLQFLDATIANVAIPHMQTSLGASFDSVTWVLTSFIIATAVATPITGWLSDRVGSRNLYLGAVAGFLITSMLCGAAQNLEQMVLFRIFQGISAAFIGPITQTILLDINPTSRHARAMSIYGIAVMIAPITGPILGGVLTENYSWRWVFYVNLPLGIPTLAILWWLLPSRPINRRRLDLFGYVTFAMALGALQLMLDRGNHADWFDSWEIWLEAAVALACFWMFAIHSATARAPLFDRELLTNRTFMTALMFMLMVGLTMIGLSALLAPMFQNLYGYSVLDTGLLLSPRAVGVLVGMIIATRLSGRVDPRIIVGVAFAICTYSLWMMTHWSLDIDARTIVTAGFVQGIGLGLSFMPMNIIAFASISASYRTEGASLMNMMRSIGGSIGISLITTLLARNIQTSHSDLAAHITAAEMQGIDRAMIERFGVTGDVAVTMLDRLINQQVAMIAYLDDFTAMMWLTLLFVPLTLLLRRPPAMAPGTAPPPME